MTQRHEVIIYQLTNAWDEGDRLGERVQDSSYGYLT